MQKRRIWVGRVPIDAVTLPEALADLAQALPVKGLDYDY